MSLYDKLHDVNSYKVHTFTSTGNSTFAVTGSGDIEYLVIAGGGGGGRDDFPSGRGTGGGGAGGFRTNVSGATSGGGASAEAKYGVTAQNYTITVGTGGAGGTGSSTTGSDGVNSSIVPASGTSIISTGGGGGGGHNDSANFAGRDGGSGGGAPNANSSSYVGSGVSGQGYAGGSPNDSIPYSGSGGGGAGSVGGSAGGGSAGNGGLGLQSSINGTATYYAGGGGGHGTSSQGSGGSGGGGSGSSGTGGAGTANTGSGGGAGDSAGAGGSGIVIIRYKTSSGITATGGTITNIVTGIAKQRMVETFSGDDVDYNRWGASAGDFGFSMEDEVDGGILLKWYNSNPVAGKEGLLTTSDTSNGNKRQFSPTNFVWIANCKWTGTRTQGVSRFGIKRDKGNGFNGGGVAGATLGSDNAKISAYTTNETSGQISVVASTIDVDNVYHNYKGARSGGAYTLLIDGVTSVTETNGYLPVNASQPFLYCYNNDTTHHSLNCNYFEVYNT